MSVTAPAGFVAGGVACGIKPGGGLDLALVATADGLAVPAAAVFTTNRAAAASVQVSRRHLTTSGGRAAGMVLSSGNANAATGARGVADVEEMAAAVAVGLERTVGEHRPGAARAPPCRLSRIGAEHDNSQTRDQVLTRSNRMARHSVCKSIREVA